MTNLDIESIRNKYKFNAETLHVAEEAGENFNKAIKLVNGKNKFRLVPFEDGTIVKRVHVHMNLGLPFLCPKKHGGEYCPSCDFGWLEYNNNGKQHTKTDKGFDISKAFLSQEKYVFRGILRAVEESDFKEFGHPMLRWYDASPTLAKDMIKYCSDPREYGEVSDIIDGTDLILTKDDAKAAARLQSVSADLARKSSPAVSLEMNDPNMVSVLDAMFANAPSFKERFAIKTAQEIDDLMKTAASRARRSERPEEGAATTGSVGFDDTSDDFDKAQASLDDRKQLDELF